MMTGLLRAVRRRSAGRAALGLLAVPLVMQACEPACAPPPPRWSEQVTIGTSWQGRPITAYRVGTPGGKVVLAIGSIHGDEQTGIEIVENIRDSAALPGDLDIWVIPTINPDGNAMNVHTNAAGVDLNRNFAPDWQQTNCATSPRYCSGPAPMSEPESQALAAFVTQIQPRMTVWYHGPLYTVDAAVLHGVANPAVLQAYASGPGYTVRTVTCSPTGYCTGNATQYMNSNIPGSSAFVVELSSSVAGSMSPAGVAKHVAGFFAAAAVA
jgi:protein MpaA